MSMINWKVRFRNKIWLGSFLSQIGLLVLLLSFLLKVYNTDRRIHLKD